MSLINPAILWGLSLVSIPVILHFLLRSRPKKYMFPALRFIRVRRQNNIRRLRLKQLWLLLLRMGVLALLVAAIARPTLPAANYHLNVTEWLTAAAIAAAGIGIYLWFVRTWRQKRLPNHVYHVPPHAASRRHGRGGLACFSCWPWCFRTGTGSRRKSPRRFPPSRRTCRWRPSSSSTAA